MSMYDEIMAGIRRKQSKEFGVYNEGDYYEDIDGYKILHCKQCGEKKQQIVFISKVSAQEHEEQFEEYALKHPKMSRLEVEKAVLSIMPPKEKRVDLGLVGVPCKCQRDYLEGLEKADKNEERRRKIKENQYYCFSATKLLKITFDRYSENKHLKAAKKYEKKFAEMYSEGKSLVLCGTSGSGKTIASICLANALLEREFKVIFKVQQEITFLTLEERNDKLDELVNCNLLIIDDFNLENITDYGRDLLFYVIDGRIKAKKPFALTTNHYKGAIEKPQNNANKRIFERIKEVSYIVEDSTHNYRDEIYNSN